MEELRDLCWSVLCTLQEMRSLPGRCPVLALPSAPFPLFPHFRHFSDLWLFESALLNSRQVQEAETFFLQTKNQESVKAFFFNLGERHKLLSGFNTNLYKPLQGFWVVFIGKRKGWFSGPGQRTHFANHYINKTENLTHVCIIHYRCFGSCL